MLKKTLKRMLKKTIAATGFVVMRKNVAQSYHTMERALMMLSQRGFSIQTVIDIGASDGSWSRLCKEYFPGPRYFLIEAQPVHQKALTKFCAQDDKTSFVLAAAGKESGKIYFDASDPFGGQASFQPYPENNIEIPMISLDEAVQQHALPGPFLLKFDTHGFEPAILEGAVQTLTRTDIIIMECYNFRIAEEAMLFYEMCRYLDERGFGCLDLVDTVYRPYDGAFWQMDLVFVRKDRPEFAYRKYR